MAEIHKKGVDFVNFLGVFAKNPQKFREFYIKKKGGKMSNYLKVIVRRICGLKMVILMRKITSVLWGIIMGILRCYNLAMGLQKALTCGRFRRVGKGKIF